MRQSRLKRYIWVSFAFYCLIMLWLLFYRARGDERSCSLEPLYTIRGYFNILFHPDIYGWGLRRYAVINFGGNILLFVPLGLFLPSLFPAQQRFWVFFLTVALTISAVEVTQYLTYTGAMDVDDLLLNTAGACLGYLLFKTTILQNI